MKTSQIFLVLASVVLACSGKTTTTKKSITITSTKTATSKPTTLSSKCNGLKNLVDHCINGETDFEYACMIAPTCMDVIDAYESKCIKNDQEEEKRIAKYVAETNLLCQKDKHNNFCNYSVDLQTTNGIRPIDVNELIEQYLVVDDHYTYREDYKCISSYVSYMKYLQNYENKTELKNIIKELKSQEYKNKVNACTSVKSKFYDSCILNKKSNLKKVCQNADLCMEIEKEYNDVCGEHAEENRGEIYFEEINGEMKNLCNHTNNGTECSISEFINNVYIKNQDKWMDDSIVNTIYTESCPKYNCRESLESFAIYLSDLNIGSNRKNVDIANIGNKVKYDLKSDKECITKMCNTLSEGYNSVYSLEKYSDINEFCDVYNSVNAKYNEDDYDYQPTTSLTDYDYYYLFKKNCRYPIEYTQKLEATKKGLCTISEGKYCDFSEQLQKLVVEKSIDYINITVDYVTSDAFDTEECRMALDNVLSYQTKFERSVFSEYLYNPIEENLPSADEYELLTRESLSVEYPEEFTHGRISAKRTAKYRSLAQDMLETNIKSLSKIFTKNDLCKYKEMYIDAIAAYKKYYWSSIENQSEFETIFSNLNKKCGKYIL